MIFSTRQVHRSEVIRPALPRPSKAEATRDEKARSQARVRIAAQALIPTDLTRVEKAETPQESSAASSAREMAERLREAAERANEYFVRTDTRLEFEVSQRTGHTIIRVIDRESGDIIREIPPEDLVSFAEKAIELRGLLFNAKG